ncbi:hypothetical protein AWC38_SpisGene10447 [Stylophora pistillata]|uniref:Death domain-containing protein n=1 Tax=Stylophora pistillata TaxID=50429 RepID=A0A2B4S2M9_STYPI|nr:hypothetical protein AWC38_SpisGene10447 [Stylophora pistillata]
MAGCYSNECSWKLRMTEDIMHTLRLPDRIGKRWKDLARNLKFTETDVGTIESDKGSTKECCIELLAVRWMKQEGEDATVERLAEGLTTIGLKSVAEILQGVLSGVDDEAGTNKSNQMENSISEIEKNCKKLRKERHQLQVRNQDLEKDKQSMTKQLQDSLEERHQLQVRKQELEKEKQSMTKQLQDSLEEFNKQSQKLRTRIQELEEELCRVKQQLHNTSQECHKSKSNSLKLGEELPGIIKDKSGQDLAENFDIAHPEDDSEDTRNNLEPERADTEGEIDAKLKDLNEQLYRNITSLLQVPETKDKLKVSVTVDLLTRLRVSLQELYSSVLSMVAETCKCNEEVKREFYDLAYHGLRAEHNDVVHRVEDLAAAQEQMSDEEKVEFGKLQQYQTNRQRQVERLENLWRGLFSTPESAPRSIHSEPCVATGKTYHREKPEGAPRSIHSEPCVATGKTYHREKDLKRQCTDPGAKPKQVKPGEQTSSPVTATTSEDEKYEVCFTKVGSIKY